VEEKNLKIIAFSGKQDDWKFWEVKFLTRARRKGFQEILLGTVEIPQDDKKLTSPSWMRRPTARFARVQRVGPLH